MGIFGSNNRRTANNVFAAGKDANPVGSIERLALGMNNINGLELLEVIAVRSQLSQTAYDSAVNTFIGTEGALSYVDAQKKLDIVAALSLKRMFSMFEEEGMSDLHQIFRAASADQKKALLADDLFEFFTGKAKLDWEASHEILEYLADLFIASIEEYAAKTDPALGQYLVDEFGLGKAFGKATIAKDGKTKVYDNAGFIALTDYASDAGILKLFEEATGDAASPMRLRAIESELYFKDKKALVLLVTAKGCCYNEFVEAYLIVTGELPEANIRQNFCAPSNFTLLMGTLGAAKAAELFPAEMKETNPNLWAWVQNDCQGATFEDMNAKERQYMLSNDALNRAYMAAGGTYSDADIRTLTAYGKPHIVAESRGK